ncbi:MAG: class I SAM-dependent methyltransferase [Candidatus Binatia bacterium]|nr:class I SAM-dependent methyltransferase [Candidatus Binatia bacterium]
MITHLPDLDPIAPSTDGPGPDHPMRKVTQQVAFDPGGWTPTRAKKVATLFDNLAPEWASQHSAQPLVSLEDALERGNVSGASCVELGAGTGPGTEVLSSHFDRLYALDLSHEMLIRLKPEWGSRVRTDASRLPLRDDSTDVLVLMNMLLFPAEAARVLRPGGALVWVNSRGDQTPIHLPPEEVARALPGNWSGKAAKAGAGLWCVLRRN